MNRSRSTSNIHLAATERGEFITLVADKRPSLLRLTTDRRKASRGLSATAELLVDVPSRDYSLLTTVDEVQGPDSQNLGAPR